MNEQDENYTLKNLRIIEAEFGPPVSEFFPLKIWSFRLTSDGYLPLHVALRYYEKEGFVGIFIAKSRCVSISNAKNCGIWHANYRFYPRDLTLQIIENIVYPKY